MSTTGAAFADQRYLDYWWPLASQKHQQINNKMVDIAALWL